MLVVDRSERYVFVICWHVTAENGAKCLIVRIDRNDMSIVSRRWNNTKPSLNTNYQRYKELHQAYR